MGREKYDRAVRPLDGTRVLDLTRLLPGGYCTLLLADMGADVVKVEEPGKGDYIRWTPPMVGEESAAHRALNRGKRSITLNLKTSEGVDLLKRLAARFEALVESFRPGVLDRLGDGWPVLHEANPTPVYLTVGALEPQFWKALCEAVGVPELIDEQFSGDAAAHEKMESVFASKSRDEWLGELAALETCVGPVNDLREAFDDPQVRHRRMV